MDYRIYGIIGIALAAVYLGVRLFGQMTFRKLVNAEVEHVLTSDEHKVKGRYQ